MSQLLLDKSTDAMHKHVIGDSVIRDVLIDASPNEQFSSEVNNWKYTNLPHIFKGLEKISLAYKWGIPTLYGLLWAKKICVDGSVEDYGLISTRVVTTAGVNAIVDAFQDLVEIETFKYHALGSGSTAEAIGNTALVTEFTTELNPNSTRATGTLAEGATANIYRTIGTNTFDASVGIREHGIFTSATAGAGTLLDRSVFSIINLDSGESLQTKYELTLTAGS